MSALKAKLKTLLPAYRDEVKGLIEANRDKVVSQVTVQQLYGGMRGVKGLICDTSVVDAEKGVIIRGYPIADLENRLPEEVFWLLMTGSLPSGEELAAFRSEIAERSAVPEYVWNMLRAMPKDAHPMTMFNTGILAMQGESEFARLYDQGISKHDLWEPALEDSLVILGRAATLAAGLYRIRYGKGDPLPADASLDMGANLAHALDCPGDQAVFANLIRMFLTVHSDHEAGNASAFTCHTVASTLSDPYYSYSASMNALAGPLHGKANQDVLRFLIEIHEKYQGVPSEDQLREFVWETLKGGRVIPGYGHAVLRKTDPRFTSLFEFGMKHLPDNEMLKLVDRLFKIVPGILIEQGKAASPYPNVDAASGALLYHFGLVEYEYYTVLFGVSRALGVLSQLVLNRAIGTPIMRPKSVSTAWVKKFCAENA